MPPSHYPIAERKLTLQVKAPYPPCLQYKLVTLGLTHIFVARVDHHIVGNVTLTIVSFKTTPVRCTNLYLRTIVYGQYIRQTGYIHHILYLGRMCQRYHQSLLYQGIVLMEVSDVDIGSG